MITCISCGKPLEKIPLWLAAVNVEFVCHDCPERKHRNIALVSNEIDKQIERRMGSMLESAAIDDGETNEV